MLNKRCVLIILTVTALVASILACNPPGPTGPKLAPDTVTPYAPATAQSQDAPPPESPTDVPSESAPTEVPAEPTETFTPSPPPATSTSAPTKTPTPPVSEGPLDFEEPHWVHAWEPREGGGVLVTVKVKIIGGAPPFTIYYDGGLHGESIEREYLLQFPAAGCGQIVHTITVESADGQSKSDDFWLGGDLLLWCD
ncbi:MAG: hypothetical protein JXA14_22530 [Anaerolineae bacterium]|nr:hypothetical protein [Anaerolineae bacterium]